MYGVSKRCRPRERFWIILALAFLALPARLAPEDSSAASRLEAARQLQKKGAAEAASNAYEALLPLFRNDADRALFALVLFETSQVALAVGDYPRAIGRAEESARLFHQQGDRHREAVAINNIGLARLYRGEYGEALQSFGRSLDLDVMERDSSGQVTRLNNIGNVYFFQGKYLDALQSYQSALQRCDQSSGEARNLRRRQLTLTNLATLYEQLGQNEKALDYYKLAQASAAALPADENAQLLSNLGTLYRRLGDPAKALETYQSARKLFSKGQHSDGQIHVLHNIGIALALDYQDLDGALRSFTEALKLAEGTSNRRQIVLGRLFRGEALYRMGRIEAARRDLDEGLAGAREIGAAEEQWTAQYGLGRIYGLEGNIAAAQDAFRQAIASIESVRSGLAQSSLKAEFLANKRDVYDAAVNLLLRTNGADREQLFALIEQARSRNLQDALRNKAPRATPHSLQAGLSAQSLLVEYWLGGDRMAAFWITRENSGVVSRPLEPGDLERIRRLAADLPQAGDSTWRSEARAVGELLLTGIPIGPQVNNLILVPDGILQNLPFELLPAGGEGRLLIERAAISYLPSAAVLLRVPKVRRMTPPWSRQLLAFGDPAPPEHGALPEEERWSRLPDSARELRSIAGAIRGRSELHAAGDDLKSYLSRAAGVPLLHLSTHAAVDTVDSNRSRIIFTQETGKKGSEYLFWREAQTLPLDGVELATLSACDTEGGKMVRGEGIQSFSRAFLAAGASATVTTLWRVADRPTADFMKKFYEHLARGETKAEALQSAKLSFFRSGSELAEPQYWAAFVLNGDGQNSLGPVLSWAWLFGPAVALLTASWLARSRRDREAPAPRTRPQSM